MSSASSTPVPPSRDGMNGDMPSKPPNMDVITKDITPPPSPLEIQDSITVLTAEDLVMNAKWRWWQGYRKDRRALGFEARDWNSLVAAVKKGQRRKRKDDD